MKRCRPASGPKQRRYIYDLFDPLPPPPPPPNSCFIPGGKEGTRLIINYLPTLPRKAIAITSRSRGQGDQRSSRFALFLPSSLPPTPLPPSHSEIYFVRARGWRTMRELGKCVTRLLALFIFARRNTPGHHAALQHPGAERIGLFWRDEAVWLILYCGSAQHWPVKPYVDCKKWDTRKWQ